MSNAFDPTSSEEPTGDGGHNEHGHDEHGHDDGHSHGGHDHAAHGPAPLPGVDPADLHSAVDQIAAALHGYIESAAGVRAEFGAHEADEDPRILAIEERVSGLNAGLYDLIHERLGMHADLTSLAWEEEPGGEHTDDASDDAPDSFHLGFYVWPPTSPSDESMDSVISMIDAGGEAIAQRLADSGFQVSEWGAARGTPVLFEDDSDEDSDGEH
ncbi:hypothetical protein SAMN05216410_1921 [Sanguibacter gelidistatuariae]|uniref:Uncharacterized protein n=1 Tax=Sanguibacter gelidistatuariae TaxID=1814289 RepID=A0A1G6MNK4_9MICO|nr:hypothetical protein [Sanguibacter gelidistatuariae]SDC56824.1 hypothetical protein SAMN05216410_1921 [Sanguibacter gelidistatuariae]